MSFIHPELPFLNTQNHKITSPQTTLYNCIAWAAEDDSRWWWPDPDMVSIGENYWPSTLPCENTIEAFIIMFESLGYEKCSDGNLEHSFVKIAIYIDVNSKPTHAARQLDNGTWTSKLGPLNDINHLQAEAVNGPAYGSIYCFMKRQK